MRTVPAGRVRCRFCKKTHKVSSYQSGSFGHVAYCPAFEITVSCIPLRPHGGRGLEHYRMATHYYGRIIDACRCTKCGGTGRQALPKRFLRRSKYDSSRQRRRNNR